MSLSPDDARRFRGELLPPEDLVRAAAQAMQGAAYGPATKRKARSAVVAVLQALAAENCDWRPEELAALAGEIEHTA